MLGMLGARGAHAQVTNPDIQESRCTPLSIPSPSGTPIRSTPGSKVGELFSHVTVGTVYVNCYIQVAEPSSLYDEFQSGLNDVTLVLRPGAGFTMDPATSTLIIPQLENYGFGLHIADSKGGALPIDSEGKGGWVLGTAEYLTDVNPIPMAVEAGKIAISYQPIQTRPAVRVGTGRIGNYNDLMVVQLVLNYGEPGAVVLAETPVSFDLTASLRFRVEGCSYNNIVKRLANARRADFTGIGTVLADSPFDLALECYGDGPVNLSIKPGFPYDSVPGVGLGDAADTRGVGIQLMDGSSGEHPWDFSQRRDLKSQLVADSYSHISVPLRARYYQTKRDVTTGPIEVIYTVTLNYD
ncbi:fimbrial protein [Bordetella avium]|nr:hypothetical protein [Bordetella avium]AZY49297.1 hypothetical protein C0J09_09185 [Bordetella avium]AZY52652.1 hypothetical protein C0J07_09170 [Bordetella avium]RIQ19186.1 hypothetical protein D0850_03715 [Bordetella avium]RIQ33354.1 hypothetical protein D0849_10405 [Bordetella avium]RIQ52754.1 hypothetical protein D0843_07855 [Bordetella avium]